MGKRSEANPYSNTRTAADRKDCLYINENQNKHRQMFADFLPRTPQTGMGKRSEAKPIPVPTKNYHKPFFAFTFQLSPHHRDGQAKRSQSLPQQKKKTNQNIHSKITATTFLISPQKTYNYGKRRTQRHRIHALRLRKH